MALFSKRKQDREAKAQKMRGLLMSASRYVQGYAENENNHPQARECAATLLADIIAAL